MKKVTLVKSLVVVHLEAGPNPLETLLSLLTPAKPQVIVVAGVIVTNLLPRMQHQIQAIMVGQVVPGKS